MEAEDLNEQEAVALLCLVRQMVMADGDVSADETAELQEIGNELGMERYEAAQATADELPNTLEAALDQAGNVERPEARELIHTIIVDLAHADGMAEEETAIVNSLRLLWGLTGRT